MRYVETSNLCILKIARVLATVHFFLPWQSVDAQIVQLDCVGKVTAVAGSPFGLTPALGTPVETEIVYDTSLPPDNDDGNTANYSQPAPNGMTVKLAGITLNSTTSNSLQVSLVANGPADRFSGSFSSIQVDGILQMNLSSLAFSFEDTTQTALPDTSLPIGFNTASYGQRTANLYDQSGIGASIDFSIDSCASPAVDNISEYLPLHAGNIWNFRVNGNPALTSQVKVLNIKPAIHRIATRVLTSSYQKSRQYLTSDSEGIRLHRMTLPVEDFFVPGRNRLIATAVPPVLLAGNTIEAANHYPSEGSVVGVIPSLGSDSYPYVADSYFAGDETVTVPAGIFKALKIESAINTAVLQINQTFYLAKNIGLVKMRQSIEGLQTDMELLNSNTTDHDLATTQLIVPAKIRLNNSLPVIKRVKVKLQNRSPHAETITKLDQLTKLIELRAESLGGCEDPVVLLDTATMQKRLPKTLKPKAQWQVEYLVTFACVNDPKPSTKTDPLHDDYRYTAAVRHSALDANLDTHPEDDQCPRTVDEPYFDPLPDGKIKEKGCGARQADGTIGGDRTTDLITQ